MALKSDPTQWGSLARFFHWTIVVLILVQATIGLVMVQLPKRPAVIPVYTFHKSLGLTIFALAVLRLTWRLFDVRPVEPVSVPHWQVNAARAGHVLLYVLIFAVPLSGWLFDSASALRPFKWFGLFDVPSLTGGQDASIKNLAKAAHFWLFCTLAAVALGHACAALIHHFVDRDDVLRRMLPWRRAP
jgi:cytochrome b561